MQAMILAAGFGTRLLPFTKLRPKPLFPLLNEPLLLLVIKRLQRSGFDHIIVNCHHLKEQIVTALDGIDGVVIQEEDVILGTGGGLRKALAAMRDEPLLVTNADIYHSVNYLELDQFHQQAESIVTMAMHDYPRFNSVLVKDGVVTGFGAENGPDVMAFTGLHVVEPQILADIPEGKESCIIERYRQLLASGKTIRAKDVSGCSWTDMGTVTDYLALHGALLQGEIPLWEEFGKQPEHSCLCKQKSDKHQLHDWVCVGEDVILPETVSLERSVVWDGAQLENGRHYSDVLLA